MRMLAASAPPGLGDGQMAETSRIRGNPAAYLRRAAAADS